MLFLWREARKNELVKRGRNAGEIHQQGELFDVSEAHFNV